MSETSFVVRYAETDQMGIVHHSNYPVWFEAGRTDFIRKYGIPYSKIEEMGVLLPLVEMKCRFIGAARYEDQITVVSRIKEMTPARIVFYYEVFKNGETKCINAGETMHAWTTTELKPVNLKKYSPELFDIICRAAEPKNE